MRAAKGRAKAWLMEVTSRVRRRSRRPEQKPRKPPRPKAAPCCIYPLPKDVCEVTKAAATAIARQMSQRQTSREPQVHHSTEHGLVFALFVICDLTLHCCLPSSSSVSAVWETPCSPSAEGPSLWWTRARWLNGWSESASKEGHPQGTTSSARHPGCTMTACEQMTGRRRC